MDDAVLKLSRMDSGYIQRQRRVYTCMHVLTQMHNLLNLKLSLYVYHDDLILKFLGLDKVEVMILNGV